MNPGQFLRDTCALAWALALLVQTSAIALASEDVPFITTPDSATLTMLQLARVKPHDYVIDLGSGDGRIVILAAKRFRARGLGVEIVPDLVQKSIENAQRAGVARRVEFREQDLFKTDLSAATVITMYLLPEVNLRLRPALLALKPGTRIVSHDWDMGEWLPDRTLTLDVPDKTIGREKTSRVYRWVVPARVAGLWCTVGQRGHTALRITQTFQQVRADVGGALTLPSFEGRLDGRTLRASPVAAGQLDMLAIGERLRVTRARGPFASLAGKVFARAEPEGCLGER